MVVDASEPQPLGALNDWASGAVQAEVAVLAVARPELSAEEHKLAVIAVSNEDAAFTRTNEDAAILAVVNGDGCVVIQHVEVAVLARIDDELLAVHRPGLAHFHLPLQIAESEVLRIWPRGLLWRACGSGGSRAAGAEPSVAKASSVAAYSLKLPPRLVFLKPIGVSPGLFAAAAAHGTPPCGKWRGVGAGRVTKCTPRLATGCAALRWIHASRGRSRHGQADLGCDAERC
mmetsp:Transcript_3873/g.7237  ORF Transcript_3873/g.7237 Transcript_3873/m.7237 type:complete len:231 (-) Transcript_3873:16-708(-)